MMALGDPRGFGGVFVFCDEKRETRAMNEVTDLLNLELDEHYPINSCQVNAEEGDDETHPLDGGPMQSKRIKSVAEEIEDELAQLGGASSSNTGGGAEESGDATHPKKFIDLKSHLKHKRARFMDVGGRGLGLVWIDQKLGSTMVSSSTLTKTLDVVDLLEPVFEAALKEKKLPTRFTSRMVPLQTIVTASSVCIAEAALNLSKAFLPSIVLGDAISTSVGGEQLSLVSHSKARPVIPFKVEMRSRSNTTLKKDEVISSISKILSGVSECYFRPDHLTHELLVIVEVVKFLAGVSIIKRSRWERFEKYNIRIAAETSEERAARFAKATNIRVLAQAKEEERDIDEDGGHIVEEGKVMMWFPPDKDKDVTSVIVSEKEGSVISAPASIPTTVISSPPHAAAAAVVAVHVPSQSRFCIEGRPDCFLTYERVGELVDMNHTFVHDDFRGKGVGGILVDKALEWAEEEGLHVNPSCTFVAATILKRHKWSRGADNIFRVGSN